jgi:hypothetical protein
VPTFAIVEGVLIRFYAEDHPPPHFHAKFAEYEAVIGIHDLAVRQGELPRAKLRAVLKWASEHQFELARAWRDLQNAKRPRRGR